MLLALHPGHVPGVMCQVKVGLKEAELAASRHCAGVVAWNGRPNINLSTVCATSLKATSTPTCHTGKSRLPALPRAQASILTKNIADSEVLNEATCTDLVVAALAE